MEDPDKIQAKITQLNNSTPGETWIALEGIYVLTSVKKEEGGSFIPLSRGMLLKAFWNKNTGEIKIYPFRKLEK